MADASATNPPPAAAGSAKHLSRFFYTGDGTLALRNSHNGEHAQVRYRREDGSYDAAAMATIRRLFRSRSDGQESDVSLRLIEVLSHVQRHTGASELVLVSGYRSVALNESLRAQGRRAAGASLHTEALAADVAVAGADLRQIWEHLRALDCCGVGLYERDGFVHVDVGPPRFWEPATSRVEENLSAENARVFSRTTFDRYRAGEEIEVMLHAVTAPPIAIDRHARLVFEDGDGADLTIRAMAPAGPGSQSGEKRCVDVAPGDPLLVPAPDISGRGRVELAVCEPRVGQTPVTIVSNTVEIQRQIWR